MSKTALIAMSGGVDSSVAAALMAQESLAPVLRSDSIGAYLGLVGRRLGGYDYEIYRRSEGSLIRIGR